MTYLWGVMSYDTPKAWPFVSTLIEEACESSQLHSPEGIRQDLIDGKTQLWVAWTGNFNEGPDVRACLITKIETSDRATWCRGILVAGRQPDDWFHHLTQIETWAKARRCSQMNFIGRCGLEHWLKPMGYKRTHFLMEKKL